MKSKNRKATNGRFYWRIVASNPQVLATTEPKVSNVGCADATTVRRLT